MSRKKDVRAAAAETTHTAADRGQAMLEQALEALAPLLDQAQGAAKEHLTPAAGAAKERLAPYADQAKDRLSPYTDQAKDRIAPLADQAKDAAKTKVAPLAATAAVSGAKLAHDTKEQLQPHLATLGELAQPAVDVAKSRVNDDLVPQLVDLLHQAENHPVVSEASKRGRATAAALRGDLELPERKERSVGATLAKATAVTAVVGAIAVAVRQFLNTKDDAWTAHQPSAAYVNESSKTTDGAPGADAAAATWVDHSNDAPKPEAPKPEAPKPAPKADDAKLDVAETTPATKADVDSEPDPHEQMSAEGGPVDDAETTNEDLAVLNEYGEGSYVGEEPPSNYTIKGNERSMKYHTADSAGYERTIADVWFNSQEAAEKAGFTRAQR